MVKISTVTRTPKSNLRATKNDMFRVNRLIGTKAQPFQAARELKRASTAAKISKIFAKPFITAMDGHSDYISCIAKNFTDINSLVSAGFDGELLVWDIQRRKVMQRVEAFEGRVRGLAVSLEKDIAVASGDDYFIKMFKVLSFEFLN